MICDTDAEMHAKISKLNDIDPTNSYKNNYRSEGIRYANARTKVIIFYKSRPLNWQLEDNNQSKAKKSSKFDHHDYKVSSLHDSTSLKGASIVLKLPTHYNNKYLFFYSLCPCYFILS